MRNSETFVRADTAFQGVGAGGRTFCLGNGMLNSLLDGDIAEDFGDPVSGNRRDRHEIPEELVRTVRATLLEHDYQLDDEIGAGGFATIYKVFSLTYRQMFAVKVTDIAERGSCAAEIDNLLPLLHPHIIKLYDTFEDEYFLYVVMEFCSEGTLKEKVTQGGPLKFRVFRPIAVQLLKALAYCHSMGIAHSDIKPPNIFFDQYGRAKLADFGLSHPLSGESSYGGSVPYMAPEVVTKVKGFDAAKADLWSLGVTFYYCGTGKMPWRSRDTAGMTREIMAGFYSTPPSMDKRILSLVAQILKVDPDRRATIDRLLEYLHTDVRSTTSSLDSTLRVLAGTRSLNSLVESQSKTHGPSRSPVRWVDTQRKVGRQRKLNCMLPMMGDSQIPPQPDMSSWA
jgi:serine/threonine protein kinase